MSKHDYYELLGVSRTATADEIKKTFRKLAMKYHPDRHTGTDAAAKKEAEHKFKEYSEAYDVLIDEEKRAIYDRYGHEGLRSMGGGRGGFHSSNFGDVLDDLFGNIFGGGGRQSGAYAERGADLAYQLVLTLEEAILGCNKEIKIPKHHECKACRGSGAKNGTELETCKTCEGYGQVRMQQGFFTIQQACPECGGQGKRIKTRCPECHGHGFQQQDKVLSIKVPAGVDEGDRIRLNGEGEPGRNGAPAGDLYIQIKISQHDIFERDGLDLYCEVPISFVMAALGGEIELPTLRGAVTLKIPPETQNGKVFRVKGKGVHNQRHNHTGDLLCRVFIEVPVDLNGKQKKILQELADSLDKEDNKHNPKQHSWLKKLKRYIKD